MKDSPAFTIRSYQQGDEALLALLFNSYTGGFVGPVRVTPGGWREQFDRQSWNAPSFEDADCCRIALAEGMVFGYAVTDYQPMWEPGGAVLQELCLAEQEGAEAVAEALIEDAEGRALARGKSFLLFELSEEDGVVAAAAAARGYLEQEDDGVFMAAVTDLAGCLRELAPALSARLAGSALRDWAGAIRFTSGEQSAGLAIAAQAVTITAPAGRPDISLTLHPDWLPLLVFGRVGIGEAYSQDAASVKAADTPHALRLLDALFPVMPAYLPRAQWW